MPAAVSAYAKSNLVVEADDSRDDRPERYYQAKNSPLVVLHPHQSVWNKLLALTMAFDKPNPNPNPTQPKCHRLTTPLPPSHRPKYLSSNHLNTT